MKLIVTILILILSFTIIHAKNPKVFIEHERGERFIPDDSDYIDVDHYNHINYHFDIYKIGVSQFMKKNRSYSVIFKTMGKDYNQSLDPADSDNNRTNTLSAYYKFKPFDILSFKMQTIYRRRRYDEFQSTKESTWLANSLLLKLRPDYKNKFLTDKTNEYTVSIRYKSTDYKYAPEKESKTLTYYIGWKKKLYENVTFKFRYKTSTINYDKENYLRIDGSKKSFLYRLEYQF